MSKTESSPPPSSAPYADEETTEGLEILSFENQAALDTYIAKLETEMRESAKTFAFERAATLRDQINDLRAKEFLFSQVIAI